MKGERGIEGNGLAGRGAGLHGHGGTNGTLNVLLVARIYGAIDDTVAWSMTLAALTDQIVRDGLALHKQKERLRNQDVNLGLQQQ